MNKNVLKLIRAILVLFSLVLGLLSALALVWIAEENSEYSQYYLDGVKFKSQDKKVAFSDAITKACSFSEAYIVNKTDAMNNLEFSIFFSGRNPMIDPASYCKAITGLKTSSVVTESIFITIQVLIFLVSAVSNTKIIQGAPDAVTLIKRLNYIAVFYGLCSLVSLISVFYYSKAGGGLITATAIDWRFSIGFYIGVFVALLPIGVSATYWYEGVIWHNTFEQDRLQWQSDRNNMPNVTNIEQHNYIQVPTDFDSVMGGLQSPSEMARAIERNVEKKQMTEQI
ncbi:hypothetical protein OIY81_1008 [Cryptosporidium canis]|uniref:Integral membrane protein n=1 Tax=Cryptosporidium canis TaxID=195482 RepID=A0ABQ8P6N8_9CRYT|nr:hypothetical protein OJ252_1990 [Cryptosporidium canis]KAJ1613452.1 hypothetical protein OIY81_1008 [Cryptosporidium canis]